MYVDIGTIGKWHERGACHGTDVNMERLNPDTRALCGACPVRKTCLRTALEEERGDPLRDRFMVRGGLSGRERFDLAASRGICELCEDPAEKGRVLCEPCQSQRFSDFRKETAQLAGMNMRYKRTCIGCGFERQNNAHLDNKWCRWCTAQKRVAS